MSLYVTKVQHQSHEPPCFLSCHHETWGGFLACGNSKIKQRTVTYSKQVVLRGREVDETALLATSFFYSQVLVELGHRLYNTSCGASSLPSAGALMYRQQRTIDTCRVLKSPSAASAPQRSPFCAGLNMAGRSQAAFG